MKKLLANQSVEAARNIYPDFDALINEFQSQLNVQ